MEVSGNFNNGAPSSSMKHTSAIAVDGSISGGDASPGAACPGPGDLPRGAPANSTVPEFEPPVGLGTAPFFSTIDAPLNGGPAEVMDFTSQCNFYLDQGALGGIWWWDAGYATCATQTAMPTPGVIGPGVCWVPLVVNAGPVTLFPTEVTVAAPNYDWRPVNAVPAPVPYPFGIAGADVGRTVTKPNWATTCPGGATSFTWRPQVTPAGPSVACANCNGANTTIDRTGGTMHFHHAPGAWPVGVYFFNGEVNDNNVHATMDACTAGALNSPQQWNNFTLIARNGMHIENNHKWCQGVGTINADAAAFVGHGIRLEDNASVVFGGTVWSDPTAAGAATDHDHMEGNTSLVIHGGFRSGGRLHLIDNSDFRLFAYDPVFLGGGAAGIPPVSVPIVSHSVY
jgi:hypothetical protein